MHFVGAWYDCRVCVTFTSCRLLCNRDTVSSVGIVRSKPLPHTDLTSHLCFFRHALALDERRVKFLPEYLHRGSSETDGQQATIPKDLDEGVKDGKFGGERPNSAKGDLLAIELQPVAMLTLLTADKHHIHAKEVWFAGSHSDM